MIEGLKKIVGETYVLTEDKDTAPYFREYRGRFVGKGLCVVRPANTAEVAAIVKFCAENKIAVTPQGGNTGLVGGSVPYQRNNLVLSLSRMNKIRSIDPENFTMTVEAGCVLAEVQKAATEAKRFFPLSIASEGSSQIGGNIAANAGGILTMRYGNTRDLVLGLEVVLPSGEIWNGLRSLRKDNTGYDLKHLFIGSEGTLGVITATVLKLMPMPGLRETFFAATDDLDKAVTLLADAKAAFGDNLAAFELIARRGVEFACTYNPQCSEPLATPAPWHILAETTGAPRSAVEEFLGAAHEKKLILDATIAQSEAQRTMFWTLRESVSDAQRYVGASIKHDISVPIFKIPAFIREATKLVEGMIEGVRPVIFGHLGDGNLHFNLTQPDGEEPEAFLAQWDEVNHAVHDIVMKYDGSFAAEHGVGVFKAEELAARKSPVEITLMKTVKRALDPNGIMNPGKVLV
jgi:FAD/FMN-containing dehydrogenase